MNRRRISQIIIAAILLAYPLIALRPFELRSPILTNHVERSQGGGLSFPAPGIALTSEPPDWVESVIREAVLDIDLRVRSASSKQSGPARILTVSRDSLTRNLLVGQDNNNLHLRLRTDGRDLNGKPGISVPDVFNEAEWVDLRVRIRPDRLALEVNGELVFDETLHADPLRSWDPRFRLALGNEMSVDRPWLGDIQRAVVIVDGKTHDYATDTSLLTPDRVRRFDHAPGLNLFANVVVFDAVINFFGFIPLGFILGRWRLRAARGKSAIAQALILVVLTSLAIETIQIFIPQRFSSFSDLLLNSLGGVFGIWCANWMSNRRKVTGAF